MQIASRTSLIPTGTDGNAAGPIATASTGARDVSVIHQRQISGSIGPHHHHDREEVLYLLSGQITIHVGDDRHLLCAGDAAIIPGGTIHRVETDGAVPAEWLLVATAGVGFFNSDGTAITPPWAA